MLTKYKKRYSLSPGNLTSCWRGVYYEKKNYDKPELHPEIKKTLDFFRTLGELGVKFQKYLTEDWRKRKVLIEPESWLPDNQWNIRGKFDAICEVDGKPTIVEVKGAGNQFFEWYQSTGQPLPAHKTQVLIYYLIMRDKYPDLIPKVLYVNRKTNKSFALDVKFTDEELSGLVDNFEKLHQYLERDELPPAVNDIEPHLVTGEPTVLLTAITCRYHSLCMNDNDWYIKALNKISPEESFDNLA